jgi:hypothetical protein
MDNVGYTYDPVESPLTAGTDVYGASASSVPEGSGNEAENYFVGLREGETEVEDERRRGKRRSSGEVSNV